MRNLKALVPKVYSYYFTKRMLLLPNDYDVLGAVCAGAVWNGASGGSGTCTIHRSLLPIPPAVLLARDAEPPTDVRLMHGVNRFVIIL